MNEINDTPTMTGMVTLKHFDATGNLLGEYCVKNLVVTAGLQYMAARMSDTTPPNQMSHMALGSDNTAPVLANTALGAQLGARVALAVAGGTPSSNTVTYSATFGSGVATGAVVEAGIFNASSSGSMLCRTTFPVINKASTDSLAVSWVITVS